MVRLIQFIGIKLSLLLLFLGMFYHFFLYIDIPNGCFIKVVPSLLEWSNLTMKKALSVIKYASPTDYQAICRYVDTLSPNPGCGGREGGCFYSTSPKTIYVSTNYKNIPWTASVIRHEACHAQQFAEKRSLSEGECYQRGSEILQKIIIY